MQTLIPIFIGSMCVYTDYRTGKIYNTLTYPLFISAVLWRGYIYGVTGVVVALCAAFITVFITSVVPLLKMGGGDKKMMAGLSAFVGLEQVLAYILIVITFIVFYNLCVKLYKDGIKSIGKAIYMELATKGEIKEISNKQIGAVFILIGYIALLIFNQFGVIP